MLWMKMCIQSVAYKKGVKISGMTENKGENALENTFPEGYNIVNPVR